MITIPSTGMYVNYIFIYLIIMIFIIMILYDSVNNISCIQYSNSILYSETTIKIMIFNNIVRYYYRRNQFKVA